MRGFGIKPKWNQNVKWKLSVACTIPVVCKQEKGASSLYGRAGSESAQTQGCEQQGGVRGGGLRGGGQEPSAHRDSHPYRGAQEGGVNSDDSSGLFEALFASS